MAEVTWGSDVDGDYADASDWLGGAAPGARDDAILAADGGSDYAVSTAMNQTVGSVQTEANATLSIGGGRFDDAGGSGAGFDSGTISVSPGAILEMGGTLGVSGTVQLQQTGTSQGSELLLASGGLTLEGGGQLELENPFIYVGAPTPIGVTPCPPAYSLDRVSAVAGGATLVNVDDTIVGAGNVGEGALTLVNESQGVIDASLTTDLTIKDVVGGITNDGLMESTGGGGLYIVSSTVDQTGGGALLAASGVIYLSEAEIDGGTLDSSGAGEFYLDHGDTVLNGAVAGGLATEGKLFLSTGATATLEGPIDNTGQIDIGAAGVESELIVGAIGATLTGGGSVVLDGLTTGSDVTGEDGATLTNVDNTICGQGTVGEGSMNLVNGGIVNANQILALTVSGAIENTGLIETTGSGGLILSGATIANAGGTISAGTGSTVTLEASDIQGGVLAVSGTGILMVAGVGDVIDGSASPVEIAGLLLAPARTTLSGEGEIDVTGRLVDRGAVDFTGPVVNDGIVQTVNGALTIEGALTGAGEALIEGGTMTFGAVVSQKVVFDGSGALVLADSQDFVGTVWKFGGADSLDLEDIASGAETTATYSGRASGGVLTVTDGTHTAEIALKGNYLSAAFTVSSDGGDGTLVTESAAPALAQAMAAFAPSPGLGASHEPTAPDLHAAGMLARPAVSHA